MSSTLTTPDRTPDRPTPAAPAEPAARFRDLVTAEWVKLWTLRSTYLIVVVTVLACIAIDVNAVHNDLTYIDHPFVPRGQLLRGATTSSRVLYDPLGSSLNKIARDLMMIAFGSLGAMTVFGEYSSGLVRTTFAAVPDRRSVVAAKLFVVVTVTTLAGLAVSAISFFVAQGMLASRHLGLSIGSPGALQAVAAFALIAPVAAVVGMALAALIRHAAGSVIAVVGVLLLLPMFFGGDRYKLLKQIGNCMPLTALERLKIDPDPALHQDLGKYAPTITTAWTVLATWALISAVVALVVVRRRDV
ncbi:ABC transporter permease [Streptacidiphilus sp. N1-10]|uniref:ABC transporter permease n=1 Tax=Streptacidiphilus jeojiensis TaxID=3229225 RepID=A0ABV6XR23_9ACTN